MTELQIGLIAVFVLMGAVTTLELVWRSTGVPSWWEATRLPIAFVVIGVFVWLEMKRKPREEPPEPKPTPVLDDKPDTQAASKLETSLVDADAESVTTAAEDHGVDPATVQGDLDWLDGEG